MHAIRQPGQGGATLIELMIGLAIVAFMLGIGVPSMTNWLSANKANAIAEFYAEGYATARREAVKHNAASRLVLSPNAVSGQADWQVDICFSGPGAACSDSSGSWSDATTPAGNDPEGQAGYRSIQRSAVGLSKADQMIPTVTPAGANTFYFTAMGWADTNIDARLTRIRFDPAGDLARQVRPVAVAVSLAGIAVKCNPTIDPPDSRACPP